MRNNIIVKENIIFMAEVSGLSVVSVVETNSSDWQNVVSTVSSNSGTWGSGSSVSGDSVFTTVWSNSGSWGSSTINIGSMYALNA